jgi:hypothetical protein
MSIIKVTQSDWRLRWWSVNIRSDRDCQPIQGQTKMLGSSRLNRYVNQFKVTQSDWRLYSFKFHRLKSHWFFLTSLDIPLLSILLRRFQLIPSAGYLNLTINFCSNTINYAEQGKGWIFWGKNLSTYYALHVYHKFQPDFMSIRIM